MLARGRHHLRRRQRAGDLDVVHLREQPEARLEPPGNEQPSGGERREGRAGQAPARNRDHARPLELGGGNAIGDRRAGVSADRGGPLVTLLAGIAEHERQAVHGSGRQREQRVVHRPRLTPPEAAAVRRYHTVGRVRPRVHPGLAGLPVDPQPRARGPGGCAERDHGVGLARLLDQLDALERAGRAGHEQVLRFGDDREPHGSGGSRRAVRRAMRSAR